MNERGNVLFYILIAVALLAALIFAVGQSGRGSVNAVNEEKARILASEIIDYNNTVATAFAQLRLRGCKLEQMSFENAVAGAYTNASAPADKTCHIFELAGGGVTYKNPPTEALTGPPVVGYTSDLEIEQVGTTCGTSSCSEVAVILGPLKREICLQLNAAVKVASVAGNPPGEEYGITGHNPYQGTIGYGATIGDDTNSDPLIEKTAACFFDINDSSYLFYKVLQTR